jgi:hypothetical protein
LDGCPVQCERNLLFLGYSRSPPHSPPPPPRHMGTSSSKVQPARVAPLDKEPSRQARRLSCTRTRARVSLSGVGSVGVETVCPACTPRLLRPAAPAAPGARLTHTHGALLLVWLCCHPGRIPHPAGAQCALRATLSRSAIVTACRCCSNTVVTGGGKGRTSGSRGLGALPTPPLLLAVAADITTCSPWVPPLCAGGRWVPVAPGALSHRLPGSRPGQPQARSPLLRAARPLASRLRAPPPPPPFQSEPGRPWSMQKWPPAWSGTWWGR